jgi:hypothetical protein
MYLSYRVILVFPDKMFKVIKAFENLATLAYYAEEEAGQVMDF